MCSTFSSDDAADTAIYFNYTLLTMYQTLCYVISLFTIRSFGVEGNNNDSE